MRAIPEILLVPLLLFILAGSFLVAGAAALSDLATWVSRLRRAAVPRETELFRGWPLALWIASAALLPDLQWRIAAGAMALEHAALLLTARREGRIVAQNPGLE